MDTSGYATTLSSRKVVTPAQCEIIDLLKLFFSEFEGLLRPAVLMSTFEVCRAPANSGRDGDRIIGVLHNSVTDECWHPRRHVVRERGDERTGTEQARVQLDQLRLEVWRLALRKPRLDDDGSKALAETLDELSL